MENNVKQPVDYVQASERLKPRAERRETQISMFDAMVLTVWAVCSVVIGWVLHASFSGCL